MVTIDDIKNAEIFSGLEEEELKNIAMICTEESLPEGTLIWREGDLAEKIYILKKGKVQINLRNKTIITIAEPGKILGWSPLVKYNKYYTATASCLEDSHFIRIMGSDILLLFREHHITGLKVMNNLSEVIAKRLDSIVEYY